MHASPEFRHVPTSRLAVLAQRLGRVAGNVVPLDARKGLASAPTSRQSGGAPRGIRAARPDEIWRFDTTVLRLVDGTRAHLQAVIDEHSRRILSWRLGERFEPGGTADLLVEAGSGLHRDSVVPVLLADAGVENRNDAVDGLVAAGRLRRVRAQTEISFSNSIIEAWWRSLKHRWLYLNRLDSVVAVRKLVAFYVEEHNTRVPHAAFDGQTPDEMYFGTGGHVPAALAIARVEARRRRLEVHRAARCAVCV